jgi:hypothetical protein
MTRGVSAALPWDSSYTLCPEMLVSGTGGFYSGRMRFGTSAKGA